MAFAEDRNLLTALCKEMLIYLGDNPNFCETWLRVMRLANKAAPVAAALGLEPPVRIKVCAAPRRARRDDESNPGGPELLTIGVAFKGPYGDCGTYHLFPHANSDTDRLMDLCADDDQDGLYWRAQANVARVLGQWLRRLLLLQPKSTQADVQPRVTHRLEVPPVVAAKAKVGKRSAMYPAERIRRRARSLREDHPELPERDLLQWLATEFGCCLRTVRNALRDAASEQPAPHPVSA